MALEMATEVETPLPLPDMSSPSRSFENLSLISCSSANPGQVISDPASRSCRKAETERSSGVPPTAVAGLSLTHAAAGAPRGAEPLEQRRRRHPSCNSNRAAAVAACAAQAPAACPAGTNSTSPSGPHRRAGPCHVAAARPVRARAQARAGAVGHHLFVHGARHRHRPSCKSIAKHKLLTPVPRGRG